MKNSLSFFFLSYNQVLELSNDYNEPLKEGVADNSDLLLTQSRDSKSKLYLSDMISHMNGRFMSGLAIRVRSLSNSNVND